MPLGALESSTLRWQALPQLWVILLVLLPLLVLGVTLFYRRDGARVAPGGRRLMAALRIFAIALLLMALFGPYAETVEGRYFKRHLILAVDTSRSMEFRDTYLDTEQRQRVWRAAGLASGGRVLQPTRLEIVQGLLTNHPQLLQDLADKFRLHVYTFDSDLAGLIEPEAEEAPESVVRRLQAQVRGLRPEGSITRIGLALHKLVRNFAARNEPVAGILLFTDGRHTGGTPDPVDEARRAALGTREGIPVFPVAIGDPRAAQNVGVSRIDAPEVVLAGDDVQFSVTIHARGYAGHTATLEVHVLEAGGSVQERLMADIPPFALPPDDETVEVSFMHLFDEPGSYDLRIGVPPQPGEAVVDDNSRRHLLRVVQQKMRVLYVVDRPFFEYRFLSAALLRAEDTMDVNILLLSADEGMPQDASTGMRPLDRFPTELKDLAQFDVVILGDVDPQSPRFAPRGIEHTLEMLEKWVTSGGGLVLQAGMEQHIPDDFLGTRLMSLLPVVVDQGARRESQQVIYGSEAKRYQLTPEGRNHPVMRVLQDPRRVREFWDGDDYATFYFWYAPAQRAKSGATVLAERREDEDLPYRAAKDPPHPLLAIQEYGAGKVLWIATDELFHMRRGVENLYYWRFWSGAIRHLATYRLLGGNKRVKIFVDRPDARYQAGDDVIVEAKFLDDDFEPVPTREEDGTQVPARGLHLILPEGSERDLLLEPIPEEPSRGRFRTRLRAGQPGTYRLYAEPEGDEERAERSFVVEETTLEMRDPLVDMETLRAIARESGGKLLTPATFLGVLDRELSATGGVLRSGERRTTDLWDRAWVLWLFVGLLGFEWILRKRNRLL